MSPTSKNIVGGIGQSKPATSDVQSMINELKAEASSHLGGKNLSPFEAVSYKTQVVAGTNYFVKVLADGGKEHVHLRVFKPLGENAKPKLHSCQAGHSQTSDIEYF